MENTPTQRTFKFRAWHSGISTRFRHPGTPAQMLYDEKPGECLVFLNQGQNIEQVMQFTGAVDATGKEIYDGDILQNGYLIQKVYWDDMFQSFRVKGLNYHDGYGSQLCEYVKDCTVIGNIYESPELITQ